ncbi:MAG TPA: DHH family phosphoesterase [Candidatus Saccharimonadales bacterium]|nr:DHH family phosphoesterase [Candidatus Saccharimonadales bacterium]
MKMAAVAKLGQLVTDASIILILQPDKPDGDSVASALALEELLADMGKTIHHFCAGRVEPYLGYLPGWDRISDEWPGRYDLSLAVDIAGDALIPRLLEQHKPQLLTKPAAVLDHHTSDIKLSFASLEVFDAAAAATGELIYLVAKKLHWPINQRAAEYLIASIQADTLNLSTPSTSTRTVAAFARLVKQGNVSLSSLSRRFRDATALDPDIMQLKGRLLAQVEFYADSQLAVLVVSGDLLKQYRQRTSLSAIVFNDMLHVRGVKIAAVMNDYGTLVRVLLRARVPIAAELAEAYGGGGHPMAASFASNDKTLPEIKQDCIQLAARLLQQHETN